MPDPLRTAAATVAATARVARLDAAGRTAMTEPARKAAVEALRARHAAEIDPDGTLATSDPAEFQRRMAAKLREHHARVSLAGVRARRAKAAAKRQAELDAEFAAIADAEFVAEESA